MAKRIYSRFTSRFVESNRAIVFRHFVVVNRWAGNRDIFCCRFHLLVKETIARVPYTLAFLGATVVFTQHQAASVAVYRVTDISIKTFSKKTKITLHYNAMHSS